ncbi:MAG: hypothetical protein JWN57_2558, partial [Frankiales bacterium]|nr:hypothetical protein [Frankiales bacterium]
MTALLTRRARPGRPARRVSRRNLRRLADRH